MSFKKKVFSGVMLSAVTLSALAPVTPLTRPAVAYANTTSDKIAAAQATIANAQASSAEAQAALNTIQASVDAANARAVQLQTESEATTAQIDALRGVIIQRNEILKKQARSAQTNGSVTSYINTVLNAKSMTDALQRVTAMSQVVQANSDMMEQQKKDKAQLEAKQAENEKAYKEATDLQKQLAVQQHDLEAAKALYQATIASTQEEKDQLLAQQASEVAAAQAAAAAQKAVEDAAAQKAAQQQAVSQSTQTSQAPSSSTGSATTVSALVPTASSSSSRSGNPLQEFAGQCTWGVYEILGYNLRDYKGNAGDWISYANTDKPAPNEIVVFTPAQAGNPYGHVAVIQSVNADGTVNVKEANYNGNPNVTYRANVSVAGSSFIIPTYN